MGGDVESVLKEVGLAEDEGTGSGPNGGMAGGDKGGKGGDERVWLHCIVGGKLDEKKPEAEEEEVGPCPSLSLSCQVALLDTLEHGAICRIRAKN